MPEPYRPDGGTTIGVWVGEDEDVVDRVDERLDYGDSRSAYAKEALELKLAVDEAIEGVGLEFDTEREKRAFVRQAILDAD
ncbi:MAG: hypothetical protein ABEH77_00235 [Halobacteriaceae archaeon]